MMMMMMMMVDDASQIHKYILYTVNEHTAVWIDCVLTLHLVSVLINNFQFLNKLRGRRVGPRPRARTQLHSWAWQLVAHAPLAYHTKFKVRRPFRSEDMTHFRSQYYVGLVTLTFVFDLETAAHYCPWGVQPFYQCWCF